MTDVPEAPRSYRQVLRDRRLATLLAGDAVAKTGDGMSLVALPLLALHLHGRVDPALAIALVTAAPYLLPVGLSLFFGLGRRRFDPRLVLLADTGLRAGVLVGLGLLALAGSLRLWTLAAALFTGSALRLLSSSSRRLVATDLVADSGRLAVHGLIGASDSLALTVAGPALGGLLAALAGPETVLLINGLSYLGLLTAAALAVPSTNREPPTTATPTGPASGWASLRRTPVTLRLLLVVFLFNFFYGPVEVALPLLVTDTLGAGGGALGALWTCFGLGAVCGALLANRLRRVPQRGLLVGIIGGWAASMGLLAVAPTIALAGAAFAVGGVIYGPFTAVAYTLLQSTLKPSDHQPVITVWAAGVTVAAPLGLGLAGPLVAASGSRGGLLASAAITAALVPAAAWWLRAGRPGCPHRATPDG